MEPSNRVFSAYREIGNLFRLVIGSSVATIFFCRFTEKSKIVIYFALVSFLSGLIGHLLVIGHIERLKHLDPYQPAMRVTSMVSIFSFLGMVVTLCFVR